MLVDQIYDKPDTQRPLIHYTRRKLAATHYIIPGVISYLNSPTQPGTDLIGQII